MGRSPWVRFWKIVIAVVVLTVFHVSQSSAQYQPPSEILLIDGKSASTWVSDQVNVIQIDGPVKIELDHATLTASNAVIWLSPAPGAVIEQQRAEIALIGDATIKQRDITRSGDHLLVSAVIRGAGTISITADERLARNLSDSELFKTATHVREGRDTATTPVDGREWLEPTGAAPPATTPTTQQVKPMEPVSFAFRNLQTFSTPDNKVAVALSGGVTLMQKRENGDFIELRADNAVLFTSLTSLRTAAEEINSIENAVVAAYLEGDVRITYTPETGKGEQRLEANRIYYEFGTDRAILTDAVLHTIEPNKQIPVVMRAQSIRQLTLGEYRAEKVELTTSSFATPSYSIKADRAYVRTYDTGDPRLGNRTVFSADHATFRAFDLPVFYLPKASGSMTDNGSPLRSLGVSNSKHFGFGVLSEWGLFETLGQQPPDGLDMTYRLDYFTDRGPAGGINASYNGGFVTDTKRDPWNFNGDFQSYIVNDHGEDDLGRDRLDVEPPHDLRGQVLWEHQHFFPDDWQIQIRSGYISDPTFMEEWFEDEWDQDQPYATELYLKRQRQTEAFTLLGSIQPNDFVTSYEYMQEQFEIERLPEAGYYRIGDSLFEDQFTFFSANTVSGLKFDESNATLEEQGFEPGTSPGLPSVGTTGTTSDTVYRGDFRQELNYPFTAGQFRVVPYVMGRYTAYSDSPDGDNQNRLMSAVGMRLTTAFWKVDDSAHSKLFDIHRIRHVVEPQVHLFTSAQNVDQNDVFIYDEAIDKINDVTAAQIAIRQRWQTKRGGPGRWRSVDFLTLDVEGNFFANQPDDDDLEPTGFRGLFFDSMPEASIPRNSINADGLWRISDSMAVLADAQYNLDDGVLATASIGLAARRDEYLSYFIGTRYIDELDSNITTLAITYQLTPKYTLGLSGSYDFGQGDSVRNSVMLTRRFDRFFMSVQAFRDETDDDNGVSFNLYPEGIAGGLSSNRLSNVLE
jgi:lipopolysaccharide assembly outer membrane protein LptD (OstA)